MTQLTDLPTELLLNIYEQLENIDDALHLARSCKLMYEVLDPQGHRLSVFSHIIQNGDHHKYDIRLDANETFRAEFCSEHYTTSEQPSDFERPPFSDDLFGDPIPNTMYKKLDPDTVWSIVTRWHAMKVLFDLYCDSTVRPSFLRSPFWQTLKHQDSLMQQTAYYGIALPAPSGQHWGIIQSFTMTERMDAYSRFYRALTSHWLHIDITWAAGVSRHADSSAYDDAFDKIKLLWLDDCERSSLPEKTEAIEVTDFVWGFLALTIFANPKIPDSFRDYIRSIDFLRDSSLWPTPLLVTPYSRMVRLATFYLPPPNIIELLVDMWTPQAVPEISHPIDSCRVNKGLYLRRLGLFDKNQGTFECDNISDTDGFWFSTDILIKMEWSGIERLLGDWGELRNPVGSNPSPYEKWKQYRYLKWENEFRGKPILYRHSEQQITRRIRNSGTIWWGSLTQ